MDSKFTLLYRGSRDGYKFEDIHSKIHNKGKTIVIIKSNTNKVFGGYTPIPWTSNGGGKKAKKTSFLFSVRDNDSVVKLEHQDGHEVYHRKQWLLEFACCLGCPHFPGHWQVQELFVLLPSHFAGCIHLLKPNMIKVRSNVVRSLIIFMVLL